MRGGKRTPSAVRSTPCENFIDGYRDYAQQLTDCPANFHDVMSLAIVGAALGNRVWFEGGASRVYPNFYLLLLGPSGCGKSYALKIAADFTDRLVKPGGEVDDETGKPLPLSPRYPNMSSPESMVDTLDENPSGVFIISELSAFMRQFGKSYMAGAQAMITDIYDGAGTLIVRTKRGGVRQIEGFNLAPSLWAASTLEWFQQNLTVEDLMGGWWNRFLLVRGAPEKFFPVQPIGNELRRQTLFNMLVKISSLAGKADDSRAQEIYTKWIYETRNRWPRGGVWGNFPRRLHLMARKLALCLEAGRTCSLSVSPDTMMEACGLAEETFQGLLAMEADELTFSAEEYQTKTIRDMIRLSGMVTRHLLSRRSRLMSNQLDVILKTLWERREIEMVQVQDSNGDWAECFKWIKGDGVGAVDLETQIPTVASSSKGKVK
jgi:hypothetical protein